ncbi:CpsD/CapB family tyrosine-protein kinase [bacterium]|nr:CpsD/CapB family tyrosine-protein kinase [bacterium]
MKSKFNPTEKKFTVLIKDTGSSENSQVLEKKLMCWFPNLSRDTISQRISRLPFAINNLPFKVANKITEDLLYLGCQVEMSAMGLLSSEREANSLSSIDEEIKVPPIRPDARLKDFFSSSYLTTFVHPKSHAAEAFRTLRTNLQFIRNTKKIKVILITSSTEDEGKSTIASNLAISMAQTDTSVLLIDADLRQPSLNRAYGYDNSVGLSSYLMKKKDISDCIFPTFIKNLSILFSGPTPPNPAELLALDLMADLIEQLKTQYELIVIDTPPVTNVTDPIILTSVVEGVYLVIKAGKTSRKIAQYAVESLSAVNASILGIILNNFDFSSHYYYQYYYSHYYREDIEKPHKNIFSRSNHKKTR